MKPHLYVRLPSGHASRLEASACAGTVAALKCHVQTLAPECLAIERLRIICDGCELDEHAAVADALGSATLVHAVYVPRLDDVIPSVVVANCLCCELTLPFKWIPQCSRCGCIAFELTARPSPRMTWADLATLQGGCWSCDMEALAGDEVVAFPAAVRFTCSNESAEVPCRAARMRAEPLTAADRYLFKPDTGLPGLEHVLESVFGFAAASGFDTAP